MNCAKCGRYASPINPCSCGNHPSSMVLSDNSPSTLVLGGYYTPTGAGGGSGRAYPLSRYFQNAKGRVQDFNVYEVYDYATWCHPTHFFGYFDAAHNVNPWYRYYLRYIVEHLFSGYYFEGPGAKEVEKFWREHNMGHQIRQLGEQCIKYGTGIAKKLIKVGKNSGNSSFAGIQTLYTPYCQVWRDMDTWDEEWRYIGHFPDDYAKLSEKDAGGGIVDTWTFGENRMENFIIFRPFPRPEEVWGFSPLQSCIHALESLHSITIEDIPAAARNHMAIQRVMKANLDGIESPAKRTEALKSLQKQFSQFNSAKADILIIHDKHDLGYITGLGGGGVGVRLENMMDFLEPIMSCINLNIDMAIGITRQETANKNTMKRQEWLAARMMEPIREYVAHAIFTQIIEPHVKPKGEVWVKFHPSEELQIERWTLSLNLFKSGVIPREFAQLQCGFDEKLWKEKMGVKTLTYVEDIEMKVAKEQAKFKPVGTSPGGDTSQRTAPGDEAKTDENDSVRGTTTETG